MKLKNNTVNKTNKLKGLRSKNMGIGNVKKVLQITTKGLYSHPIRTAVQEYISNAKDSHDQAKVCTSKIEITAPTLSDLCLKIKDFGTGMSEDEVFDIYTQVGASTKDKSNDFLGAFGFGAKSWFAVAPSFSLVSIKNKERCLFNISLDDTEFAKVELLSKEKTKEANGVEVILPLNEHKEVQEVKDAVARAIRFWPKKPKTTNFAIENLTPEFEGENGIVFDRAENKSLKNYANVIVSFGGIEYFLDEETARKLDQDNPFCNSRYYRSSESEKVVALKVNLGEIEVPSDRERILVNQKSLALLKSRLKNIKDEYVKEIKQEIKKDWSKVKYWSEKLTFDVEDINLKKDGPVNFMADLKNGDIEVFVDRGGNIGSNHFETTFFYYNEKKHLCRSSKRHNYDKDKKTTIILNDQDLSESTLKKRLKTTASQVFYICPWDLEKETQKVLEKYNFSFKTVSKMKFKKEREKSQGRSQVRPVLSNHTSSVLFLKKCPSVHYYITEDTYTNLSGACSFVINNTGYLKALKDKKVAVLKDQDLEFFPKAKKMTPEKIKSLLGDLQENFYYSAALDKVEQDSLSCSVLNEDEVKGKSLRQRLLEKFKFDSTMIEQRRDSFRATEYYKPNPNRISFYQKQIQKEVDKVKGKNKKKMIEQEIWLRVQSALQSNETFDYYHTSQMKKNLDKLKVKKTPFIEAIYTLMSVSHKYSYDSKVFTKTDMSQIKTKAKKLTELISNKKKKRPFVFDTVFSELQNNIKPKNAKEIKELLALIEKP